MNFNEKIPFNIEKIAKNRKIPKKKPEKIRKCAKSQIFRSLSIRKFKEFSKKLIWGPRGPQNEYLGPRGPQKCKNSKNAYFYI